MLLFILQVAARKAVERDGKECHLSVLRIGLKGQKIAEVGKAGVDLADLTAAVYWFIGFNSKDTCRLYCRHRDRANLSLLCTVGKC